MASPGRQTGRSDGASKICLTAPSRAWPRGRERHVQHNASPRPPSPAHHARQLYVADDRKQASLDGFWPTLTPAQRDGIAVAMDMWEPYVQSTRAHLPEADGKIVFDSSTSSNTCMRPSTGCGAASIGRPREGFRTFGEYRYPGAARTFLTDGMRQRHAALSVCQLRPASVVERPRHPALLSRRILSPARGRGSVGGAT